MVIVDINSTKFEFFVNKSFRLKNSADSYILGKNADNFYLINLENHQVFDLLLLMEDYDNFYRIDENEDFFGVLIEETLDNK